MQSKAFTPAGATGPGSRSALRPWPWQSRGQALILACLAMLVFCVGVLVLFNTGQVVNKKVQLNNTADAAAYSAAVQQARAYNMVAYLNRAQVANEVAIAQMVSLHSYMNYVVTGSRNAKDVVQGIATLLEISVVAAEVGAVLQEAAEALDAVKDVLEGVRDTMRPALSGLIGILSTANVAYSGASEFLLLEQKVEIPLVVNSVIKANTTGATGSNDKAASLGAKSLVLLEAQMLTAQSFVKRYRVPNTSGTSTTRSADADRFKNVVMEARDGFSKDREHNFLILRHKGGTDMEGYNRWVGLDTLTIHIPLLIGHVDVPWAWGGAAAIKVGSTTDFKRLALPGQSWNAPYPSDKRTYKPYGGALDSGGTEDLAIAEPAEPSADLAILRGYAGLQSYDDVNNDKTKAYASKTYDNDSVDLKVGPYFTVLVEQQMKDVDTSDQTHIGGPHDGSFVDISAPDKAQNNKMTALASAQVFFSRPRELFPRSSDSDYRELGSLFSPYWQARLVDTPATAKAEVFGADMIP
jgi:Flp pilus assembly protein TadG